MSNDQDHAKVANFSAAVGNVAAELVAVGVKPMLVAKGLADALGRILAGHIEPRAAAAMLRNEAGRIEGTVKAKGLAHDEHELLDMHRRFHEFMNTLQIAGCEESAIVSVAVNVGVERVARTHGVDGATAWLRGLAVNAETHRAAIDACAKAR